jgi:hypothetical protein
VFGKVDFKGESTCVADLHEQTEYCDKSFHICLQKKNWGREAKEKKTLSADTLPALPPKMLCHYFAGSVKPHLSVFRVAILQKYHRNDVLMCTIHLCVGTLNEVTILSIGYRETPFAPSHIFKPGIGRTLVDIDIPGGGRLPITQTRKLNTFGIRTKSIVPRLVLTLVEAITPKNELCKPSAALTDETGVRVRIVRLKQLKAVAKEIAGIVVDVYIVTTHFTHRVEVVTTNKDNDRQLGIVLVKPKDFLQTSAITMGTRWWKDSVLHIDGSIRLKLKNGQNAW